MNINKLIPLYKDINFSNDTSKYICKKEFGMVSLKKENSIITKLFYPQLTISFTFTCKHKFYSLQNISDITLILAEKKPYCHIKDLLNIYFKEEIIRFERLCVGCNKMGKHLKNLKLSHLLNLYYICKDLILQRTQKMKLKYI